MPYYDDGELGAIDYDNAIKNAKRGFAPMENVINGVTYRTENGKVYRKERNGRLTQITNPQELLALDRQYVPPPPIRLEAMPGYENQPDGQNNTSLVVMAIAGIALLFILKK